MSNTESGDMFYHKRSNITEQENTPIPDDPETKLRMDIEASLLLSALDNILKEFTEENKAEFARILRNVRIAILDNILSSNDGYHLVSRLIQTENTPYFHFFIDQLYIFYVKLLLKTVKQSNQTKIMVYEHLLCAYGSVELFPDIVALYSSIDNFSMGVSMFKNYALYKILDKEMKKHVENRKYGDACKFMLSIVAYIDDCPGFVDYLVKNTKSLSLRSLIIVYVYWWLDKVPVDLNKVQSITEIKDVECKVMSKIFTAFSCLRSSFWACSRVNGPLLAEGVEGDVNRASKGTAEREELGFEVFLFKFLFKHDDLRCIFSSIYKRLTFFFLIQNKRLFSSVKMLRVFSKAEMQKIYKLVRCCKPAFVNVFTQLDRRYILRELSHSLDLQVFKEINPSLLGGSDLLFYYQAYLMIVEREKIEDLTLKVTNLDTFSRAFNALSDKSFIPHIKIILEEDIQQITIETAQMLVYYSTYHRNTFLDVVFLSSILLENRNALFQSQKIPFYVNVLIVLSNISETVNLPLRRRFLPLIKKLLCYDAYVLCAGMLSTAFGFSPAIYKDFTDIKVLAALNYPSFETVIGEKKLSDLESETAILYYIHHNPSYAQSAKGVLLSILQRFDHNTSILLDFLERLLPETLFPVSFVSENIDIFYFLLDTHRQILPIFISSLRYRSILPCMVIPYIICGTECDYVFRMHQMTVLNSVPEALYVVTKRIRLALNNRSIETETGTVESYDNGRTNTSEINKSEELFPGGCEKVFLQQKLISKDDLKSIVDYELRIPFIDSICKSVGPQKVAKKMPPMPGVLMTFVILRQLRNLDKKSKEIFFSVLEENAQDEQVMDLIGLSREFYKHMNKGIIPVEYMLKLVDGE